VEENEQGRGQGDEQGLEEISPDELGLDSGDPFEPELVPFDLDKAREEVRGRIAIALLVLVFLLVSASFLMVAWGGDAQLKAVEKILGIVWGPVVALVSAATGFYFGSQSANSKPS
jgi:hypothetical protein